MKPRHFVLFAVGAILLLFLAQNLDLFQSTRAFRVRFLVWEVGLRPAAAVFLLPAAGFVAGYLVRWARDLSRRKSRTIEEARREPIDEEAPRLPRASAPDPATTEAPR